MSYGTVTVGRLALTEVSTNASETSGRVLSLQGQESYPSADGTMTLPKLASVYDDIMNLPNRLVPVTLTDKAQLNGYYTVSMATADLVRWNGGEVVTCDWKLTLQRLGAENELDLESRLSGAQTRNSTISATGGERWHAPPIGHYAYWSSTTQPSTVTRTGQDGAITVYRQVPVQVNTRWACPVASYMNGRVKFLDSNGFERTGTMFSTGTTGWWFTNGLVALNSTDGASGNGVMQVSAYTGGAWRSRKWDIQSGGVSLGAVDGVSLLRNDPEACVLRMLFNMSTPGRVTVDATIRRGSRFVEFYVQSEYAATLKIVRATTEAGTAGTGFVRATNNDSDGNRYVIGSALTFTADTTIGGISLASTTTLDAFIGMEVGGSSAVAGDQAANLFAQYLGSPSEQVQGVRR